MYITVNFTKGSSRFVIIFSQSEYTEYAGSGGGSMVAVRFFKMLIMMHRALQFHTGLILKNLIFWQGVQKRVICVCF